MKSIRALAAAAAVGSVTCAASANGNLEYQVLDCPETFFGMHSTVFGDDPVNSFGVGLKPNTSAIVGIQIDFVYDEVDMFGNPALDGSWASDIGMILDIDGFTIGFGGSFRNLGILAGGYSFAAAEAAVDRYRIWDFDGSGSDMPGVYHHEYMFEDFVLFKPEELLVFTTDTWNGNTSYENLTITLIKKPIPAPGAMALLALAGMFSKRRRA